MIPPFRLKCQSVGTGLRAGARRVRRLIGSVVDRLRPGGTLVLLLIPLVMAGCATTPSATPVAWEYRIVEASRLPEFILRSGEEIQSLPRKELLDRIGLYLNALGDEGWEMTGATGRTSEIDLLFFKRARDRRAVTR